MARLRALPLLLAGACLVSACGSTVATTGAAAGAPAADSLMAPAAAAPDGALPGAPQPAGDPLAPVSGGGDAGVPIPVAAQPGADAVAPRRGAAPPVAAAGAPQDRTPVRIGIFYLEGGNQAISAGFGNTPVSFGDGKREAQAVVDDINSRGGIGGRRMLPFYAAVQAANANGAGLEAACRRLIEDDRVQVIASMFNVRSQLVQCASKGGAILLDVALGAGDEDLYREFPDTLFTPSQLNLDSEQRLVITNAADAGQLAGAKVGVLIQQDDETFQRVYDGTMKPLLTQLRVPVQSSTIANATATNDISAAVLRFKADGVTHVMFSTGNGGIPPLFFLQGAEQQGFRPKYLMGDSTNTWFVGDGGPREQVRNISGAGTYPIANVAAGQYPTTPREKRCLQVITDAGQRVADRHSSLTATFYCEMLYGFAAVGATVQGPLTKAAWRAAYYRMGTSYPAITTFRSNLSNGRNDNPAAYRLLGWKASCSCISYLSPERPLPF